MKEAPIHLLYESAYRGNIIPVTSVCNVSCVFCSHKQNPPGIEIYRIPPLESVQLEEMLQFISPEQKIIIGESVTRIIEGEPFTNAHIIDILVLLRKRFPHTEIRITSNGTLIDQEKAGILAKLGHIEINLSMNSADPLQRKKLMHDKNPGIAVRAAEILAEAGIPFHGSVVAMPHLTGWDDLGQTLEYLAGAGAKTIRVFLPGFTKLAPGSLKFSSSLWQELHSYVKSFTEGFRVPVTVEPGLITNLKAEVAGVIQGSSAAAAGLLKNDTILQVDGTACFSRVDAFHRVKSVGPVNLDILRNGEELSLTIDKAPSESPGLVMEYDIDPETVRAISRTAGKYRRVWILSSVLAAPVLQTALQQIDVLNLGEFKYKIVPVQNTFFGGTIMSAGLLLVSDFLKAFRQGGADRGRDKGDGSGSDAIFVPSIAFDRKGRDLAGNSYLSLQEETGLKVEII